MGRAGFVDKSTDRFNDVRKKFEGFFEEQLISIGLSKDQIDTQSLEELEDSLVRVNDAIKNCHSFGTLKIRFSAKAGAVLATADSESHFEIGILPLLLERKKLIIDHRFSHGFKRHGLTTPSGTKNSVILV